MTVSVDNEAIANPPLLFNNDFEITDLQIFDDATLGHLLRTASFGLSAANLGLSLKGVDVSLVARVRANLPDEARRQFQTLWRRPASLKQIEAARHAILDNLFWELTYWKTPELYEELTEGEKLHPGIFQSLGPQLAGKTVLDVGAGSGRATFECLQHGAKVVHAVEPSPGLLKILARKIAHHPKGSQIITHPGRFENVPLDDNSIDVAIACSAFTGADEQGGEPGLAELRRVVKPGGSIFIIWPQPHDRKWLKQHGFKHVSLPTPTPMKVRFRSLQSAWRAVRRFYARNREAADYLQQHGQPELPFEVLGFEPPCDYAYLQVA